VGEELVPAVQEVADHLGPRARRARRLTRGVALQRAASEKWADGTPDDWVAESTKIAKDTVYGTLPGFACGTKLTTTVKLPDSYLTAGQDIAEVRIAKGGFRLAEILNRALGGN
jgi:hypothetical protein